MMTELPVIDVSGLTSGEFSVRAGVAAELGHACREIGFFYVVNHGIAQTEPRCYVCSLPGILCAAGRGQGGVFD